MTEVELDFLPIDDDDDAPIVLVSEDDEPFPEEPGRVDNLAFTTKKFALQSLFDKAIAVVPTHDGVQPVLKNFLVEAGGGQLRVSATDMEQSIVATGQLVLVTRPGKCVLPAKRMEAIVREAEEGDISIDVEGGTATVRIGPTVWSVKIQECADYPPLPEEGVHDYSEVDRVAFIAALQTVRYAATKDTLRPGYMMVNITDGQVRATDGVRFQQVLCPGLPDMDIPITAVADLIRTLKSCEVDKVAIAQDETQLIFRVGADMFVSQRPTAPFLDVENEMRKKARTNDAELVCDRDELTYAIRRVRITADESTSAVIIEMGPDGVKVRSQDKFGSWAEEAIDATWSGPERVVCFNWQQLLELLQQQENKSVSLKFGKDTPTRPSVVIVADGDTEAILNQIRLDHVR